MTARQPLFGIEGWRKVGGERAAAPPEKGQGRNSDSSVSYIPEGMGV